MNIDVSNADTISSPECIGCLECVTVCPTKKATLVTTLAGKSWKAWKIAALGLAIYLGAMGVGALLGQLDFIGPSLVSLAQSGSLAVEDIKGSSTWSMVADSFGIELERLYREAGVDASKVPADTKLKDTGPLIGADFEADTVRIAVAKIIGVPYAGEDGALVVPAASEVASDAVAAPAPATPSLSPGAATSSTLVVPADFVLEGTMTIRDVAAALSAADAEVIAKLGLSADIAVDKPLRDMKDQYGYTMPDLKEKFAK